LIKGAEICYPLMKPHGILVSIIIRAGVSKVSQIPTVRKLKEND